MLLPFHEQRPAILATEFTLALAVEQCRGGGLIATRMAHRFPHQHVATASHLPSEATILYCPTVVLTYLPESSVRHPYFKVDDMFKNTILYRSSWAVPLKHIDWGGHF